MQTIVIEATPCPSCGRPMPAGTLAGLCPACLLAQGAASESGDGGRGGRFVPPSLEEIARLFPQLEILSLLGAGGMGAVYQARQPALDRVVALKVLPAKGAGGANFEERFNREARALARLNHPNIVAVFEFGQVGGEGGLHFLIMEFVDGANLRQLEKAGRLAPREALQIIPQICDALQYAHDEGVVHRDIKPENVLLDRKGRVKIADFGLAKILGQETDALRLTAEGQVMGTPHYMAPEQIEKPLTVDHRADIYSLGVVLYEMLTGDLPIGKFSPPSRKFQLDVRLDDVVLRALENDPARRYQHASEVKTQVENINSTPTPASAAPLVESQRIEENPRPVPTTPPRPRSLVVVAALFMVAGGLAAWDVGSSSFRTQNINLNFGVLALPVGIGLMRLRPKWRATALLMLWLPLVLAAFAGVMAFSGNLHLSSFTKVKFFGQTLTGPAGLLGAMAAGVVWFAVFVWTNHVLLRADVVALFQRKGWVRPWIEWAALAGAILLAFAVSPRDGTPIASVVRQEWTAPKTARAQLAVLDPTTGTPQAQLTPHGTVELLAVSDAGSASNGWWRPNGTPVPDAQYDHADSGRLDFNGWAEKDLVLRWRDLPTGAEGPYVEFDSSGAFNSGGKSWRNVKSFFGTLPVRATFPPTATKATMRVGFDLAAWKTVSTHDRNGNGHELKTSPGVPKLQAQVHNVSENNGAAHLTVLLAKEGRDWKTRVIAVDTNGVEHPEQLGTSTPADKTSVLTCEFIGLPLARVKEFRVQARPVQWIEFRDVALRPRGPSASALSPDLK